MEKLKLLVRCRTTIGLRGAKDRVDAQVFGEMAEACQVQLKLYCGVRPSRLSTVNKKWKVSKSRR
jgi:hypothetical protein